jgi:hypothetical protein
LAPAGFELSVLLLGRLITTYKCCSEPTNQLTNCPRETELSLVNEMIVEMRPQNEEKKCIGCKIKLYCEQEYFEIHYVNVVGK